jgi:general nucleoside transport system permease protein
MDRLARWADVVLVPLVSLILAATISAMVLLSIGQSPVEAFNVMVEGALGRPTAGATRCTTRPASSSPGLR